MTRYIILTAAERDAIRGQSTPYAAIEPVELRDGTFVIGDDVLVDQVHASRITRVAGLVVKSRTDKATIDALKPADNTDDKVVRARS